MRDMPMEDRYRLISAMQGSPYQTQITPDGSGGDLMNYMGAALMGSKIGSSLSGPDPWTEYGMSNDFGDEGISYDDWMAMG